VIVDPDKYRWHDENWDGVSSDTPVIYEMHLGTFTEEGTWSSARERISYLKDLGVDVLEIMPIAEFPGKFGWGYDGVCLFAPSALYGEPDEAKRFIVVSRDAPRQFHRIVCCLDKVGGGGGGFHHNCDSFFVRV
jgi:maltooligosyltrehalose trehalohydrolase